MNIRTLVVFQENPIPYFGIKNRHIEQLRKAFPRASVIWCRSERSFLRYLPKADVAFTWKWESSWFSRASHLRCIATPAAGHDFFPAEIPPRVRVHFGTYHGEFMAETLLGMMLAFQRGILDAYRRQLDGELWPRMTLAEPLSLRDTHAVIIGVGHVGEYVMRLLKSFGVRITGVCRHPDKAAFPSCLDGNDRIIGVEELDSVLPSADHLILILPNDTGTDKMIDARRIALLPVRAVLYNIGRGNCVDEVALAAALESRSVRGACLDVFAQEPLTDASPLAKNLPGLLRLPHASAFSEFYMDRFVSEAVAWLKGKK